MYLNLPGKGRPMPGLSPVAKTLRIMKLIALLLFVGCLQVSAKGFAQKITLHEKNAPLQKIFKEIRKQSGYLFLYTDELIKDARNTDVVVSNVSLEDALRAAFREQPLTFTIVNKTIIIKRKEETPAPLPPSLEILARHTIRGNVVDADKNPVSGASVVLHVPNTAPVPQPTANLFSPISHPANTRS